MNLSDPQLVEEEQSEHAFIGRQPVIDAGQNIVGYELLYRRDADAGEAGIGTAGELDTTLAADVSVIANALTNMGTDWLLGDKLAFINVSPAALRYVDLLRPDRVVLETPATAGAATMTHLAALRSRGFRLCLDDLANVDTPLLAIADYVKLDLQRLQGGEFAKLVGALAARGTRIIAKRVETAEQFEACRKLGVKHFQGFYFARPVTCRVKTIHAAHANLVRLMQLTHAHAALPEIENVLKRDVAISFKLMRYINSAGFGLSCEITSFRHAVTLLGYDKLYRWLSLMLMTAVRTAGGAALARTAVTRGRMAELLGTAYFEPEDRDNLFIVGMFSLLDAMLEMPMAEIQEQLKLPEKIGDALLTRSGIYGPFIDLVEACEGTNLQRIVEISAGLQISAASCNRAHLEALSWAEALAI
jgi:c-di-GMP-related signal transduction protein